MDCETAVTGLFSIVTAGIAYLAAVRKYTKTTKDSDKSIYVAAVTNERARWRSELRENVSEYCKLSIEKNANLGNLQQVKTQIILRLNPRANDTDGLQKHKFDREIIENVNAIFSLLSVSMKDDISTLVKKLEISAQELLKQEWDKSKTEACSGEPPKNA